MHLKLLQLVSASGVSQSIMAASAYKDTCVCVCVSMGTCLCFGLRCATVKYVVQKVTNNSIEESAFLKRVSPK